MSIVKPRTPALHCTALHCTGLLHYSDVFSSGDMISANTKLVANYRWKVEERDLKSTLFELEYHREELRRSIAFSCIVVQLVLFSYLGTGNAVILKPTVCYDLLNLPLVLQRSLLLYITLPVPAVHNNIELYSLL